MTTLSYADQKEINTLLQQYKDAFRDNDRASMRQLESDALQWGHLFKALTPLRQRYNFALGYIDGVQLSKAYMQGNGAYFDGFDKGYIEATEPPTPTSIRRICAHFRRLATTEPDFFVYEKSPATDYAIRKATYLLREGGIDSNYSYFRTLETLISDYINLGPDGLHTKARREREESNADYFMAVYSSKY